MKRFLAFLSVIAALFFCALLTAPLAPRFAQATVMGVFPGDLIKLKDDKTVYYFDKDWFRRPFPNQRVFESWYEGFGSVKEVTAEEMAEVRLGKPVVYRPGTRLIKVPSIPKVYAVEPNGLLRWIETEAVAKSLFGDDWARRVDDVSDAFFTNYKEGAPLVAPLWPTGSVLRKSDGTLYLIDGMTKRRISAAAAPSLRLRPAYAISVDDAALAVYADRGDVVAWEPAVVDTAQITFIDTMSPPVFDFPVAVRQLTAGTEQGIAAFRVSSGLPVIIRGIRVTLKGPLWNGATPNFSDLKFVDVNGVNLFGTTQLQTSGATEETIAFSGAYTMNANAVSVIELRTTSAAGLPKGSSMTVSLDRGGIILGDGTNGNPIADFYPKAAFPVMTLEVK